MKVGGRSFWTKVYATQKEAAAARGPLRDERTGEVARTSADAPVTIGAFREWWLQRERTNTKLMRERGTPQKALKRQSINNYADQTKEFAEAFADRTLLSVTKPEAIAWLIVPDDDSRDRRWQHNGGRRMFTAAANMGAGPSANPFKELRLLGGSTGRKKLDPLVTGPEKVPHLWRLADCALRARPDWVGHQWRTIILLLGFVGLRPGELYGLERPDFDLRSGRLHIRRQYARGLRAEERDDPLDTTKNWEPRQVALPGWVVDAVRELPTPITGPMWQTARRRRLTGATQHYYWHPIRTVFGNPSMDLYEPRHFCGWWMVNVLERPESQVALHLGHTDGGVLVRGLLRPCRPTSRHRRDAERLRQRRRDDGPQRGAAPGQHRPDGHQLGTIGQPVWL